MPSPRSAKAPYFSGQPDDRLADFLFEYDILASGYKLSDKEKVETILRYVPFSVRELWKTLAGYASGNWATFRATLEDLYPDIAATARYTKNVLKDFIQLSSRHRIRDENDVLQYYHRFLTISNPLRNANQITEEDRSADFFLGFHPDDRDVLSPRLFSMKPYHPSNKPHDLVDVLTAARGYFSDAQFYRPADRRRRDDPLAWTEPGPADPDQWMQRLFGREDRDPRLYSHNRDAQLDRDLQYDRIVLRDQPPAPRPEYETRTVCFKDADSRQATQAKEDRKLADIITKIHGLSVHDPTYAVLYAQCKWRFPDIAQELAKPDLFQTASTAAYQALVSQAWSQPTTTLPVKPISTPARQSSPPIAVPTDPSQFFRRPPRTSGCVFCAQRGHQVRGCPAVEEYVRTGRTLIKNDRLHLPNGQPIPNDGSGRGLKHAIDTWLAADSARPSEPSAVPTQLKAIAAFQHTPIFSDST